MLELAASAIVTASAMLLFGHWCYQAWRLLSPRSTAANQPVEAIRPADSPTVHAGPGSHILQPTKD